MLDEMEVESEELAIEEVELDRVIIMKKVEKVMYKHYSKMLDELNEFVNVDFAELEVAVDYSDEEMEGFSIKIR